MPIRSAEGRILAWFRIGMTMDDFQIDGIRHDVTESLKSAVMYSIPLDPKTTAYQRWNCKVIRLATCHLIPSNRFLDGFPDPSQFAAAKLTHYSTMPHRPSDFSRPR